jgi:hypothetical protein
MVTFPANDYSKLGSIRCTGGVEFFERFLHCRQFLCDNDGELTLVMDGCKFLKTFCIAFDNILQKRHLDTREFGQAISCCAFDREAVDLPSFSTDW